MTAELKFSQQELDTERLYHPKVFTYRETPDPQVNEKIQYFLDLFISGDLNPELQGYSTLCQIKGSFRMDENGKYSVEKDLKEIQCCRPSEMTRKIGSMNFGKHDYYVTLNRMKSPHKRCKNNLFGLNALVIDIDNHDFQVEYIKGEYAAWKLEIFNDFTSGLLSGALDEIPMPNAVVFTGRGLQLWYKLSPASFKLKKVYTKYAQQLESAVRDFIQHCDLKDCISVDATTSTNFAGLVRLPGTWNTSAKTYGDFFLIHDDEIDLVEEAAKARKAMGLRFLSRPDPKMQAAARKGKKRKNNALAMARKREEALTDLAGLRREEGSPGGELRDLNLLIIYSAFRTATDDDEFAMERTRAFNSLFEHPFTEKQINSYLTTARKRGGYRFTNKSIIEFLGISEAEQKEIDFHEVSAKEKAERAARRAKRQMRDKGILYYCEEGIETETEIAELVGCSKSTVCRVLKKYGKKTKKQKTHDAVVRSLRKGREEQKVIRTYRNRMSASGVHYLALRVQGIQKGTIVCRKGRLRAKPCCSGG